MADFAEMVKELRQTEAYAQESARCEISEQICRKMKRRKVSRAEMARRLNTSRSYVTQLLQGNGNFTLDKMAEIAHALGCELRVQLVEKKEGAAPRVRLEV